MRKLNDLRNLIKEEKDEKILHYKGMKTVIGERMGKIAEEYGQ